MSDFELVINPYEQADSKNRKGIILCNRWKDEYLEIIERNEVTALYLNISKGWSETDYSFLSKIGKLEELDIIAGSCINIKTIESLPLLEELSLTVTTKDKINFSKLKNLKKCFLFCGNGVCNIDECISLVDLHVDKLKKYDFQKFESFINLRRLVIGNSDIADLSFLSKLQSIETIELLNCKSIVDFSSLSTCMTLKRIRIDGFKRLGSINFIEHLKNIEILILRDVGEIDSIQVLEKLKNLKAVSFGGKTNIIDGNLTCLNKLPKLSLLMFQDRKHYTHKIIKSWNWKNIDIPDQLLAEK